MVGVFCGNSQLHTIKPGEKALALDAFEVVKEGKSAAEQGTGCIAIMSVTSWPFRPVPVPNQERFVSPHEKWSPNRQFPFLKVETKIERRKVTETVQGRFRLIYILSNMHICTYISTCCTYICTYTQVSILSYVVGIRCVMTVILYGINSKQSQTQIIILYQKPFMHAYIYGYNQINFHKYLN